MGILCLHKAMPISNLRPMTTTGPDNPNETTAVGCSLKRDAVMSTTTSSLAWPSPSFQQKWAQRCGSLGGGVPWRLVGYCVVRWRPLLWAGEALGFGLTFPNPKRALGAHGVPLWGSSAPAHHTHPLAMQPAGGAHASSSSIVARVLSAAVSLACSRCAFVVTGTEENTGNAHCTAVGSCHVKRSCRGSVWTTAASHSSTWSRTASVAMSFATSWSTACTLGVEVRTIRGLGRDRIR